MMATVRVCTEVSVALALARRIMQLLVGDEEVFVVAASMLLWPSNDF